MKKWRPRHRFLFIVGASLGLWAAIIGLARADTLDRINQRVNHAHVYGSPLPGSADGIFDCEDYAIAKRKILGRGAVVLVTDETGRLHAVLEVDGRILDNRFPWTQSRADLTRFGYVFL